MIINLILKPGAVIFAFAALFILGIPSNCLPLDVTAKSCSAADIQAAISAAEAGGGGTAYMPACDYTSTSPNGALWASGSKICVEGTNPIRLLGQGINNTRIGVVDGYSAGYSGPCSGRKEAVPIQIGSANNNAVGVKEVGQFYFDAKHTGTAILQYQCCSYTNTTYCNTGYETTNFRLHHVYLHDCGSSGSYCTEFWYNHNSVSLIDHVTLDSSTPGNAWPYGIVIISGWNPSDNAFRFPIPLGQNDGVFVEDSDFNGLYHSFDGYYAFHMTFRHNTIENSSTGTSGHEAGYTVGAIAPPDLTGPNLTEIYDNTVDNPSASAFYFRNGFYIVTNNNVTVAGGSSGYMVELLDTAGETRSGCTTGAGCPYAYTGYSKSTQCYQIPLAWVWNNTTNSSVPVNNESGSGCPVIGTGVLYRAPQSGDYGFSGTSYTPFTYPHPLQTGTNPSAPTKLSISQ